MKTHLQLELDRFLASQHRNLWIEDDIMKVYVRQANRIFHGIGFHKCLDIASVEVKNPKNWGKGFFTAFLNYAISVNPHNYLYVENVQEPRFRNYFRRRGWLPSPTADWCFYLCHDSANCEPV